MRDLPWNLRATTAPLGIAGRVSDAQQIRDAGGIRLHICPATSNLPTRITRASWERLCAATQLKSLERECIDKNQAQLMRMTRRLNVCAWCRGKILPRGLEFIDAAEMAAMIKPKEEAMAKQSKIGVCENCGDKGALTGSFGRQVCTTCLKIRSNVNSHLEKVATAARDMGRGPELLAALVPDGGGLAIQVTADLLQDIAGLVDYQGEDPAELVEAVRSMALREASSECQVCADLKGDLLMACDLDLDLGKAQDWDYVATAAIQEIAGLTNRKNFWIEAATELKAKVVELNELIGIGEAKLILAEQARDEWEQRAVQAEANVADQAAELNADDTRLRDELTRTGAELERLRDRAQESESRLIWYREALAVLRDRLGLDHLGEDEDVVERMLEAIASQAQALTRFQEMARTADLRADEVEADIRTALQASESDEQTIDVAHRRMAVIKTLDRLYNAAEERATLLQDDLAQRDTIIANLREQLAATDQSSADSELWEPEPAPTVPTSTWGDESLLADFGRRVLRGEVAVSFQGVRP